jgi:hypothetical protein
VIVYYYMALKHARWDTPQHVLIDDPESGDTADAIWPGQSHDEYFNLSTKILL